MFLEWYLHHHLPYFSRHTRVKLKSVKLIPGLIEELLGLFKSKRPDTDRTSERTNLTETDYEIALNAENATTNQFLDQSDIRPKKHCAVKMFTSLYDICFNDETIAVKNGPAPPPQDMDASTYHVAMGSQIKKLCIKTYASLPHLDKFLVKERIHRIIRVKLKSCQMNRYSY